MAIERAGERQPQGLVDILDKILDKGLVIAGDIKVNLANVELLTIQLRLVVCSIDKAEEIGLSWWRSERFYAGRQDRKLREQEIAALRDRVNSLEKQLSSGTGKSKSKAKTGATRSKKSSKKKAR